MNQTELEKTQLEIAKLQLEQEKHKLAQMQRRSEAVSDLGRGAAAVGGVAAKGVALSLAAVGGALVGALLGLALVGYYILLYGKTSCQARFPNASMMYKIGCAFGEYGDLTIASVAVFSIATALRACWDGLRRRG